MNKFFFTLLMFSVQTLVSAQAPFTKAVKDLTYTFVSEEGTNASAVVWHPEKNLYFTVIAGNQDFPFEAFDSKGKSSYSNFIGLDTRGMWYNPKTRSLELNASGDEGWYSITLKKDMTTHVTESIAEGQNQPDFQSVGTFDPVKKAVVFFDAENYGLKFYGQKNPKSISSLKLDLSDEELSFFNQTTVGYTGKKGFEYVLLNIELKKLYFFDRKGKKTAETNIGEEAVLGEMFLFSFTNNRAFFYNTDNRTWTAYNVFK